MKRYLFPAIILLALLLRFYKLGSIPPSLYWDEASLGYNAYSILKTGHDEHGKFLPLTNFAAFGDYKPPGYIYAAVLPIAVLGPTEFAIRFPSAFFGTLTVILTYFLAKKLFGKEEIALLASFFLAISPWHLQFSRGAFESNLGLFFSTLGIFLFLKFVFDNKFWIIPSLLAFLAAMYTFTGQRLFIPFIIVILFINFRKQIYQNLKITIFALLIFVLLFWPLFKFATQTIEGRLRFNEVTIFKDLEPINKSINYRQKDSFAFWADIIHNRRLQYAHQYLIHYLDAFNPNFLFIRGDVNPRLSVQEVGELYLIDLPLILAGVYFLFSKKQKFTFLIISWLLVSPLGPATARETPHALRMLHILPTFQLIAAFGLFHLYRQIKYRKTFLAFTFLLLVFNLLFYLHMYYFHWPRNFSDQWQYGYKEAVKKTNSLYEEADHIIVTKKLGRPYIYFLLYSQPDPRKFWQESEKGNIIRDKFYFIDVKGFDKYRFLENVEDTNETGKIIYVSRPDNVPHGAQVLETIYQLNGHPALIISSQEKQIN